ncbi:hypothetical protein ACRAWG_31075 [Methylobacterium sp. P31]
MSGSSKADQARASVSGAPPEDVRHVSLAVDQACGMSLVAVLDERRGIAARTGRLEDSVALGALLADLREFDEADEGAVIPVQAAWHRGAHVDDARHREMNEASVADPDVTRGEHGERVGCMDVFDLSGPGSGSVGRAPTFDPIRQWRVTGLHRPDAMRDVLTSALAC